MPKRRKSETVDVTEGNARLRKAVLADADYGMHIATRSATLVLTTASEQHTRDFRRFRWPLTPGYEFETYLTPESFILVVLRDRSGHPGLVGGRLSEAAEPSLSPRPTWFDDLRKRHRLDDAGALLLLPLRTEKTDGPSLVASWTAPDEEFISHQIALNLDHHCRFLGLRREQTEGQREPLPGTKEAEALEKLRSRPGQFVKLVVPTNVIDHLRKRHGFTIESAAEARAAGKTDAKGAVGYRLLDLSE